jgi:hypothetical protein
MFNKEYLRSKYIVKKKRLLNNSKYLKMIAKLEENLLLMILKIADTEKNYEELSEVEKNIVAQKKVELFLEFGSIYRKEFLKKFQEGVKDTNRTADMLMRFTEIQ